MSYRGDVKDVLRSGAVTCEFSHPAEVRGHVADHADGVFSVMLHDTQHLFILLLGHFPQLRCLVQLNVQLFDKRAFWLSNI